MTKIQQTEDYSSFKRISGNRTINKAQVSKLFASLGDNPELASAAPIIVNDKKEIIDGQHRFEALKKLGLPIYYFEVDGLSLKDVQVLNSATKTWSPLDYAKSFSELGYKDYDTYLEFRKKYKLNHHILLSYLSNGASNFANTNTIQTFRSGRFKAPNVDKSHRLCKELVEMQAFYKRGDSRAFAFAFKAIASNPVYDHQRMLQKMVICSAKILKDSPYAEDYVRQLEKIYNHHCALENRVRLF